MSKLLIEGQKVGIDVDDVLCDFSHRLLKWYNSENGTSHNIDDVIEFNMAKVLGISSDQFKREIDAFYDTRFCRYLPAKDGAVDGINRLIEGGNTLYLITSRWDLAKSYTKDWINERFSYANFEDLVFAPNGKKSAVEYFELDCMIDDALHNVWAIIGGGAAPIIMDQPWNRPHEQRSKKDNLCAKLAERVNGWDDIN